MAFAVLIEMIGEEKIDCSKTLNASSATIIFLAYYTVELVTATLIETLARPSLVWLGEALCPMIGFFALVLFATILVPEDITRAAPNGSAWVVGRWENLFKGLAIGCTVGASDLLWNTFNRPHVWHNGLFVEPISRMILMRGVQQALAFLALALIGPITEEMTFRGILYGGFRKSFGPLWAASITTGIFVAVHFPYYIDAPSKVAFYIVASLVLLLCRLRWNAVGPAIAAHSGINIVLVIIPSLFWTWQHPH